jgi:hypothetical protein
MDWRNFWCILSHGYSCSCGWYKSLFEHENNSNQTVSFTKNTGHGIQTVGTTACWKGACSLHGFLATRPQPFDFTHYTK